MSAIAAAADRVWRSSRLLHPLSPSPSSLPSIKVPPPVPLSVNKIKRAKLILSFIIFHLQSLKLQPTPDPTAMTYAAYVRRSPSPGYSRDHRAPGDTYIPGSSDPTQPRRPPNAPAAEPNPVLGVFGLSVRTRERDLEDEFSKYGDVEKVVIVYDQRVSRSTLLGTCD